MQLAYLTAIAGGTAKTGGVVFADW